MYTCVHVDLDLDLLCSFFRSQIFANAFFTYDGQTRFDNSQSISISRASQRNRRPSRSTIAPVMYVVAIAGEMGRMRGPSEPLSKPRFPDRERDVFVYSSSVR